jgi:hypothetical protein
MFHLHWLTWCALGLFLFLLYWITRRRKPPKRLPGHKHYCWECKKTYTCPDKDCTTDFPKAHPACQFRRLTRRDRAA